MKKILLTIIGLLIALAPITWDFPKCSVPLIKNAFPPKIFFETTIDGLGQNTLITRFLHNKVGIYGSVTTKCYFDLLDPKLIYTNFGVATFMFLAMFTYQSAKQKIWLLLILFLLLPILSILGLPLLLFVIALKIFAIIGLILKLKK